jgi:hypothetical protein
MTTLEVLAQATWEKFEIFKNRRFRARFSLFQGDGRSPAGLAAGDVVRFKLWRQDGTIALDVDSNGPTALGSVIVVENVGEEDVTAAVALLKIHKGDSNALASGQYKGELLVVNDETSEPPDVACRGPVIVTGSPAGDIGLA